MTSHLNAIDRELAHQAGYSTTSFVREVAASFPAFIPPDYNTTATISNDKFRPEADTLYARYLGRATGGRAILNVATQLDTKLGDSTVYLGLAATDAPPFFNPVNVRELATGTVAAEVGTMSVPVNYVPETGEYIWAFFYYSTGVASDYVGVTGEFGLGTIQRARNVGRSPRVGDAVQLSKLPPFANSAQLPLLSVLTE